MFFVFSLRLCFGIYAQDVLPTNNGILEGDWLLKIQHKDIGVVNAMMQFENDGQNFHAFSRKGADREILGFWTASLGRIFTDDFKKGSLLRITDGITAMRNDTLRLAAIFSSVLGDNYFNGYLIDGKMHAILRNGKKEFVGSIVATKNILRVPIENYSAIIDETLELTKAKIFNPKIPKTDEWEKFEENIKRFAPKAQDDLEMVFAFFYYAGKLPISHYALIKIPNETEKKKSDAEKLLFLEELDSSNVLLRVKSFGGSAGAMDSIFGLVEKKNYRNLIIDLRNNPGGSVAAGMEMAKNLADTTFYGGVFLTQKWFKEHDSIPNPSQFSDLPHFTDANYDLIIEGIHQQKALCLKVVPKKKTFTGNVFILTSNKTASTCEPIVYGLKRRGLATIVGEKTAGSMLNGEVFKISHGYSVIVPTADYYTADGYRIDQNGVEPNIKVPSEEALDYVLENLIRE